MILPFLTTEILVLGREVDLLADVPIAIHDHWDGSSICEIVILDYYMSVVI